MKKKLTITIQPDGKVEIAVEGVKGQSCVKLTEFLEEALGEVTKRDKTSEFYAKVYEDGVKDSY
jgi:hypothetical protein